MVIGELSRITNLNNLYQFYKLFFMKQGNSDTPASRPPPKFAQVRMASRAAALRHRASAKPEGGNAAASSWNCTHEQSVDRLLEPDRGSGLSSCERTEQRNPVRHTRYGHRLYFQPDSRNGGPQSLGCAKRQRQHGSLGPERHRGSRRWAVGRVRPRERFQY